MKTFKQYIIEGTGYPSADYDEKKDPDSEVKDFDPRSDGEDKFKKSHTKKKTVKDYPVDADDQFDGGTKKSNTKSDSAVKSPESGERTLNLQGTSKLPDRSGFGKSSYRKQDKKEGQKKVPSMKEENNIQESVLEDLRKIARSGKEEDIKFSNGKTLEVDETSAKKILDTYEDLSSSRKGKFEKLLSKGESSFMKALDFAATI